MIVELANRRLYLSLQRLADRHAAVDDMGHRPDRHAGEVGHFLDRGHLLTSLQVYRYRSLSRIFFASIFIGPVVLCNWMPIRPLILRPDLSSSTTMLITRPFIIWMMVLPRAMMWMSFQSSSLMSFCNSAPSPSDETAPARLPSGM